MSGKSEVRVSCTDQVLKITESPVIASGGLNEVSVIFSFCEKWDGFVKTAIFYRDEENVYYAVLDENDTCVVPWEVCYEEGTFYFSVFGEKADRRRTASVVRYKVKKGAITTDMLPSDPTPEVYDQIMALVAEAIERSKSFKAEAEEVIEAAQQATASALIATEEANTSAANARKATADAITATESAKTAATNAIEIANAAANNANTVANQAAERANTAASNADAAKANAITATNNANSATNRANAAVDSANNATANANTATARANNSARDADTAASNANTATSNANQATQNANNAANNANAEAGKATQAAADANTATTEANTAASEARAATAETNTAREAIVQETGEILASLSNAVYATPIECNVTGDVITVNDASNQQLAGLNIYGKTTQNGTPTPSAPVPLKSAGESGAISVTVAGKNLFDPAIFTDNNFTETEGVYYGNAGSLFTRDVVIEGVFKENTQYTVSCKTKSTTATGVNSYLTLTFHYTDGTEKDVLRCMNLEEGINVGTSAGGKTLEYIEFLYGSTPYSFYIWDVQLEEGDTATAYEPYKGQTATFFTPNGLHGIDVLEEVKDEIDLARGVRVQRTQTVDMGSLKWGYKDLQYGYFYATVPGKTRSSSGVLCTAYKHSIDSNWRYEDLVINDAVQNWYWEVNVRNTAYTDAETFKAAMSGQTLLFVLEQPIETPLTAEELASYAALHSNKPNTTVFNDAGAGLEIAYVADTKRYIDRQLAAISAAMLNA